MAKRIPKSIKKAIVKSLVGSTDPLASTSIADRINNDPEVPASLVRSPKQIAYILNVLAREHPNIIKSVSLSKNGTSHHGTERFRKAFTIKKGITLAEAEQAVGVTQKSRKKQMTVSLSDESMDYIKAWRKIHNLSAGQVVENLIRADLDANGMPTEDA